MSKNGGGAIQVSVVFFKGQFCISTKSFLQEAKGFLKNLETKLLHKLYFLSLVQSTNGAAKMAPGNRATKLWRWWWRSNGVTWTQELHHIASIQKQKMKEAFIPPSFYFTNILKWKWKFSNGQNQFGEWWQARDSPATAMPCAIINRI